MKWPIFTRIFADPPGDESLGTPAEPLYLLEIEFNGDRIIRLAANLSADNEGVLGAMAKLWEKYRDVSITEAVENLDVRAAEEALFGKRQSPLAATVAGLILLRAHRLDLLHTWLHNLADWFPQRPDGPVLWAEQQLLQSADSNAAEIVEYVLKLRDRGLPQTAEAFGYAISQVDALLQFQDLNAAQKSELEGLQLKLRQALPFFRTGGLFTTFAGRKGELSQTLVM